MKRPGLIWMLVLGSAGCDGGPISDWPKGRGGGEPASHTPDESQGESAGGTTGGGANGARDDDAADGTANAGGESTMLSGNGGAAGGGSAGASGQNGGLQPGGLGMTGSGDLGDDGQRGPGHHADGGLGLGGSNADGGLGLGGSNADGGLGLGGDGGVVLDDAGSDRPDAAGTDVLRCGSTAGPSEEDTCAGRRCATTLEGLTAQADSAGACSDAAALSKVCDGELARVVAQCAQMGVLSLRPASVILDCACEHPALADVDRGCLDCYVAEITCALSQCLVACFHDVQACEDCRAARCGAAFAACAGLPSPD